MKSTLCQLAMCRNFSNASFFRWLVAFLFLLLSVTLARAQNKKWDKTFGGSLSDGLTALVATPDGGFLLGGSSLSNKSGDKSEDSRNTPNIGNDVGDYWILKTDATGKKVWDKTLGGDNSEELTSMIATPDGGFLLGGSSHSGKTGDKSEKNRADFDQNGQITPDYWIVKIDGNGKKEWDKTFGGTGTDQLTTLIATTDGGYLLGGSSDSDRGGDKSEGRRGKDAFYDYWIVKIKADGTKQWDKTFGCSFLDALTAVQQTSDGGYLLGGYSESNTCLDKSEPQKGYSDFWLVRIDEKGKKIWDKTFGGDGGEALESILPTNDGGYLLGGSSGSGISGDKSTLFPGYWVVKINAGGSKIWDKSYGGSSNDRFGSMIAAPDGGYLLAGISTRGKGRDKSEEKKGYWVVKIKENGAKVWERTFGSLDFRFNWPAYFALALVATPDKGYLLGGTNAAGVGGDKTEASRGSNDYWIVKVADSNKKAQNITFTTPLITKTLGDTPITLSAMASSGLPITYSVVSGPASLTQNTLTFTGPGRVLVKASQAGNDTYAAATDVLQTIIVDNPTPVTKIWDKTFGGNDYEGLTAMVTTPDGGYLLGGNSGSGKNGDKSTANKGFWLVKVNKDGTKEWDLVLNTFGDLGDMLSSLIVTPDGGYLLGATSFFDFSSLYRVLKISSTGAPEWDKTFGGFNESGNNLTTLIATTDGGYLLGGDSSSDISRDKSEPSRGGDDYWIIKIDSLGNKQWDKTLGGDGHDFLSALVALPNGGYLAGGYSGSSKSGDKSEPNKGTVNQYGYSSSDYWVVKIDNNGKKLWDKTVGGNQEDYLQAIGTASDGGFVLSGSSNSIKSGDKSETNKGLPDANGILTSDFWVVKLNANGSKVWDKTLGGNDNDGLAKMIATPDGGFLLGGSSNSEMGEDKSGEIRGLDRVYGDYWVVKINDNGKKVWDKTFGGNNGDRLTTLLVTPEGDYLLGGNSFSGANGDKTEPLRDTGLYLRGDFWLVKLKEEQPLTAQWDIRYGGSGNDNLTSVIKTSDGGYLSGGYTNSDNNGDKSQSSQGKNDYWIVKSDKNGKNIWDKRFGGSGDDYLNRIIQTSDGGYLLGGSSFSEVSGDKTEPSQGGRDYWVVKVDKQGNKQWDKTFGGSGSDELRKVIQLASGEYVLGGHSNSPTGGNKSQNSQGKTDYWLVKISINCTIIWDKRYGGSLDETLGSFVETRDEGFLLGGTSLSSKSGDKTQGSQGASDYWIVKTDKAGNLVWEKTYGGIGQDEVYSVGRSGEDFFIAGTSSSDKNGDKTQESKGSKDYWLLKLDKTGTKLWDKTFGGSKDDELRASTYTSQGHYILAGHSNSNVSGDKTQTTQGESDYWIVEVDADGDKILDQRFGGSGTDELRTVFQANDGGLLLGGRSNSGVSGDRTQPSQGGTDYWLVKVAPVTSSLIATRNTTIPVEASVKTKLTPFIAYPNPFWKTVTISFTLTETQTATIKVFDIGGKEVATLFQAEAQASKSYQVEWQADKQATGMYLLQLQTPTQQSTQKLFLAK